MVEWYILYIEDLAYGHVAALEMLESECNIYNLGTGYGHSVLDIVKKFEEVTGIKIPYEFAERRIGDNPTIIADNTKALAILNWEAKRSLDDMCRDGWEWFKRNPKGY